MKSGQKQIFLTGVLLLIFGHLVLSFKRTTPSKTQKEALVTLQNIAKTQYDEANEEHVALLQQVKEKFNVQDDWTTIGFQRRTSPITDFRAFGMLSLHCLNKTEVHERMQMFMNGTPICLPFAITYLNVGNEILTKMANDDKYLAGLQFQDQNRIIETFVFYVDKHILNFEKEWIKSKPQNIMSYNIIWNQYKRRTGLK